MLVTIKTEDVRIGMFVHAVGGGWMASPFWRPQFVITKPGEIRKLRDANPFLAERELRAGDQLVIPE